MYPDDDDEDDILGLVTSEVVDVVAVSGICCLYTQNMLDRRSMMMWGALSLWSLAMSLRVMTACISMSDTILGLGAGLWASEMTMSKEILRLAELLVMRGSMAV